MAQFNLPKLEEELLKKWEEDGIFKKVLGREDNPRGSFVFFEGPPTANGKPGIHHLLTRTFKDVMLRFRTMQGYKVDRKAGWDTHGLPVELEVEKQLGFTRKQQIEEYGIAAFNAKCKESVWKYLDLWQKTTKRVGFWVDLENPYVTYRNDYVESLWSIMKEIDKKGLFYEGYRVTPHCPRCVTSLSSHELAQGYKDTDDPSVFVKFPITGREKAFFLVWTTTPWTLPANVALAVGAEVAYVEALMPDGVTLVLAKDRLAALDGEYEVTKEVRGADLVGMTYVPLYALADDAKAYGVHSADFVSTEDGTGIVHIAPAYGEDDAALGKAVGLPTLHTVDTTGMMTGEAPGKGKFFKKADADVMADLAARGLLYKSGTVRHSYPFCWRCDTPILYYAKSSWYIRMSDLRDRLVANNDKVNWIPGHIRDGRFGEWLREVKDWAISRERYWGTPLPIWRCANGHHLAVGSLAELDERSRPKNTYFLQRHGESEHNVANIVTCAPEKKEWHLTAHGREQVEKSAAVLKAQGVTKIYASPLLRTREAAEIISGVTGVEVVYDDRLVELDVGEFNGKTIQEYHAYFSEKLERFSKPAPGGESLLDVRKRMVAFMKDIDARHIGEKIVVIGHGDPLWLMLTGFAGLSDEETLAADYIDVGECADFKLKNAPYDEYGHVDVHRPYIDGVVLRCEECGADMRRVADVADVWFDSGAMPFAQWHYPFENAGRIDGRTNFPADFISEAIDQTRGWFYTLLAVSTLMGYDEPPYKNVICLGHVLDAKGQKMSKSKGNVVEPSAMMDKWGADAVRWYFATVNQPGEPKRFDEKSLDEVTKKVFLILWNVLAYYKLYADAADTTVKPTHALDRWLASETAGLVADVTSKFESYDIVGAGREIARFIDELSTWYVRRSRDRFKNGTADERAAAAATLGAAVRTVAALMAPIAPFLGDALYKEAGGTGDSVHLSLWPETQPGAFDADLRFEMDAVRKAASSGLEKRAAAGIPVRQALAKATVSAPIEYKDWMRDILAVELNVRKVEWKKGEYGIELDIEITADLAREGLARRIKREANDERKKKGFSITDTGKFVYDPNTDGIWKEVLREWGAKIAGDTGMSPEFGEVEPPEDSGDEWRIIDDDDYGRFRFMISRLDSDEE
jgi:isoleucyl-tRNA synthetase